MLGNNSKVRNSKAEKRIDIGNLRNWAEIDLKALRHNFGVAADSDRQIIAIIKANAYGHGALPVATALESQDGFLAFGVATLAEALELREGEISTPILILGSSLPEERETIVREGFWITISSLTEAETFDQLGKKHGKQIPVHLMVDTGMGRLGIREDRFDENVSRQLRKLRHIQIIGLASHFPSADEDDRFTREQAERFRNVIKTARAGGLDPKHIHLANSAGILNYSAEIKVTTAARPGLMLYGISPLPEFQPILRPVLSLKTRVTLVREMPPGHGISYGRTFITRQPTRVATLAIGYGDGMMRHLSGRSTEILVGGMRCPLLGRVTMDQIMVDVTPLGDKVNPGDEAVLIGSQGEEEITATELAEKAGTISWEIFTSITARVTRVYV